MEPFREDMRYEYPLTSDSWVIDAGAYHGTFSREISRRYDCNILAFEPVFTEEAKKDQSHKVMVIPHALGNSTRTEMFRSGGDWTGLYLENGNDERVNVQDVYLLSYRFGNIDLMKLNIEGMELEVMERILETGMHPKIGDFQIQFHTCAPDYFERRKKIRERLSETHELTYDYPFVWENWHRR